MTIYTFLFPITSLHPDAAAKAHTIWCAQDRSKAWTRWMLEGTEPARAAEDCKDDPLDELQSLGQKLRIASTPVAFFSNGQRVSGSMNVEQMKKKFAALEAAPPKTAASN